MSREEFVYRFVISHYNDLSLARAVIEANKAYDYIATYKGNI